MINKKKILAIVPARGGSKGIKLKNLKKIKGKSLIEITAKFISKCKFIDCMAISTDHPKIAFEGKRFGLDIVDRPKKLSGDKISDTKVLLHALIQLEKIKNKKFDIIIMLHPTSPLRSINDIKRSLELIISKKYDSVWTVSKTDTKFHPDKQLIIKNDKIKYFTKKGNKVFYRQQLSKVYHRNSNAYIVNRNFFLNKKTLMSNNSGAYIIKSKQISIDTIDDLETAKKYFK
jgi:CMP-N,N'-diacetyllegionaminic acid synthase|tara:strand:- start:2795 stop:3487 length:693 start_codon:yes stop_codon:yes gene_type:complete